MCAWWRHGNEAKAESGQSNEKLQQRVLSQRTSKKKESESGPKLEVEMEKRESGSERATEDSLRTRVANAFKVMLLIIVMFLPAL